MTINKEQALLRVAEIQSCLRELTDEAAALRKIIEAPEKVEKKPLVPSFILRAEVVVENWFRKEQTTLAMAYAEAFNTLLDLHRQPGSEAAESLTKQWYINSNGVVAYTANLEWKLQQLCTMFDTEASALAAREAVGWDRIKRMMDTLHGRGYE